MLFNPSSTEVRQFFCEAWRRRQEGLPSDPLQSMAASWCAEHPEYQDLLSKPEQAIQHVYSPESGRENPFLHLAMHLALEEQIGADQPPGIRAVWQACMRQQQDRHQAAHHAMECLGRVLWEAQRAQKTPDSEQYLECLRRCLG